MAELKTKENNASVKKFLESVKDEKKREDCKKLLKIMETITKQKPKMWGKTIVGFGTYHYKYASGREGDFFMSGFSPRAQNLTIYLMEGFDNHKDLLKKLGKHKIGKCCLYLDKLEDVDIKLLKKLIKSSHDYMKKRYHS